MLPHFAHFRNPSQHPRRLPPALPRHVAAPQSLPSWPKTEHLKWPTDIKQQAPVGRVNLQYAPRGAATCLLNPSQRPLRSNGLPAPPYVSHIARLLLHFCTLQHLPAVLCTSLVTICTTGRNVRKPCILPRQYTCVFPSVSRCNKQ